MAYEYTTRDYEKPSTALQWAASLAWTNDNAYSQVSCTLIKERKKGQDTKSSLSLKIITGR